MNHFLYFCAGAATVALVMAVTWYGLDLAFEWGYVIGVSTCKVGL